MRERSLPFLLVCLTVPALVLAASGIAHWLPPAAWWPQLVAPNPADLRQIVAADSLLPRIATALLAGAALGLSGGLAQLALRNPLASPGTLGVSAGAALALAATTLYAPFLLDLFGREVIAFAGGAAGIGLVLGIGARSRLDPAAVALAGLAVGLYAGSVASVLSVLHSRQLSGLFVWSAGTLTQLGWDMPRILLLTVGLGIGATALLARSLSLLDLPDAVSRGLGVPVGLVRAAALVLSVGLAATVTAQVGVIGFVGLAAPALARLGGTGRQMLIWSPALGAALLLATDQLVQLLSGADGALLPTGAFNALLGVPLLLWLLPRVAANTAEVATTAVGPRLGPAAATLQRLALALLAVTAVALFVGRGGDGWAWSAGTLMQRAPRVAAAGMAGVALAAAGTVLQRVLGNPMASPEVLGLGSFALAGSAVGLWLGATGFAARLGFGAAGAGAVLMVVLLFGRGRSMRIVLAGIALASAAEAATALLLASGDPRSEIVLLWLSGSTYGVAPSTVRLSGLALLAGLLGCVACLRWLDVLPLGPAVAATLGIPVRRARFLTLLLATLLTAFGAILAGPLSFVGLVAPHVARLLGLHRAGLQLAAAGLAGATLLIAADWLGRNLLFPSEIPAGMLAALLGGPVLLSALGRARMTALHPSLPGSFPAPFVRFSETIVISAPDAIPLPELMEQPRLLSTAARYASSFEGGDARAALSMWSQHYLLALIPCATAAMLAARQDLPIGLDSMAVILTGEGQPCRLCVRDAGGDTAQTCPVRRLAPLLQTHLRPLAQGLATAGLSPLVFWSNAAAVLAWSLGVIDASKAECDAVWTAMSATCWPTADLDGEMPNPFRQVIGTTPSVRRICCLRHRLGCMARCADCPASRCRRP